MRQILFRGKEIETGEWIFGSLLSGYLENGRVQILNHDNGDLEDIVPETVGQFTGLTDKNGKKIFEGDIIQIAFKIHDKSTYLISWDEEGYRWGYDCLSENRPYQGEPVISIEYIGNIYDNPELLGESHEHH